MVLLKMKNDNRSVMAKSALLDWIKEEYVPNINKEFGELLITAGAGDIDMLLESIKNELKAI